MSSKTIRAIANETIITVHGWNRGQERDDGAFHLDKPQVQILYALAEADELALSHEGLYEVLRGSPATRFSRDKVLTAEQKERVLAYLTPLYDLGLVEQRPDDGRPQLTTAGLKLITWLTRRWSGWLAYSRETGISHF